MDNSKEEHILDIFKTQQLGFYSSVQTRLISDENLSDFEFRCLVYILANLNTNGVFIQSSKRIAEEMNKKSERTIQTTIRKLADSEYLEIVDNGYVRVITGGKKLGYPGIDNLTVVGELIKTSTPPAKNCTPPAKNCTPPLDIEGDLFDEIDNNNVELENTKSCNVINKDIYNINKNINLKKYKKNEEKQYHNLCPKILDDFNKYLSELGEPQKSGNSLLLEIDRMIRLDNRNPDEIIEIIGNLKTDPFWSRNILSIKKLRIQYGRLKHLARTNGQSSTRSITKLSRTNTKYEGNISSEWDTI